MKTCFSTLACPDFTWQEIYSMAKDFDFDGIELRGLGNDIISYKALPFRDSEIDKTVAKLSSLNLEIPCLSSGAVLKDAENFDQVVEEVTQYAILAKKLNSSYIRVLGDREPAPEGEVDDSVVCEALRKLAPIAEEYNVTLLIETNGVYADTKRLRKLLDDVGSRKVAALWDLHHPYRYFNEKPEETVNNLDEYIKYCHVKDSIMKDGKISYRLMGDGDMPLEEMQSLLKERSIETYHLIDHQNPRRVIRALEIYQTTGKTKTQLDLESIQEAKYTFRQYGILWDKEALYARIEKRIDRMLEEGLVEEV